VAAPAASTSPSTSSGHAGAPFTLRRHLVGPETGPRTALIDSSTNSSVARAEASGATATVSDPLSTIFAASIGPLADSEVGSGSRCAENTGPAAETIDFTRSGLSLPIVPGIMTKNET
jgi:hypothetical protein